MSDMSYCNTKEGMHEKAKELSIKPWSLGCRCKECTGEFGKIIETIYEERKGLKK